jgi:8-oxo-dGTP pyrophosphatase MutT (NUDIX family)
MRPFSRLLYTLNRLRWRIVKPMTVGARLILDQERRILLVKHTYHRRWYLPGGGVKRGETIEQAARREAAEEIGAQLGSLSLLGVYTSLYEHKSDHVIVFCCTEFTLTGETDAEIAEFGFFEFDDLPLDTSPGTRRRIEEYVNWKGSPSVRLW